jgi:ABC-2 type transport system permease protein
MMTLTGTMLLLRQGVRRDRVIVPASVTVLVLLAYASASATATLFSSVTERVRVATSVNEQPGLVALYGPILDPNSAGELAMSKLTVLYALFSAILYVVLVRRHTRVEEETGRAELTAGNGIGRNAPMAAVALECGVVAVALGLLVAVADMAGGLPVAGSAWFGVSWLGTGLVATGVAAVACQLSASARTCGAIAAGLLGGAFAVRAVGDGVDGLSWLSWLSPLGWNTQLRAWSDARWWVAGLYGVLAAVLLALAQLMRSRRDLGAGLLAARPGPVAGRIAGPWSLTFRLHRTSLVLWTLGVAVMSALFGAMAPGFDDLLSGTGGRELVDRLGGTFVAALLPVASIVISCFPISVVSHAHQDEEVGRTGWALATATSRARWFTATGATAWGGAAWLLLVAGTALWMGYAAAGGRDAAATVPAAIGWIPAVWLVAALALAGFALRLGWVGWACLVIFPAITIVGELMELPAWVTRLSPYSAVPAYPASAWTWTPDLVLVALAVSVASGAWWLFDRRDLA